MDIANIELPEHGGIEDRRVPAGNVEEVCLVVNLDKEDTVPPCLN
jgi:hypothetical protein